MRYIAFSMRTFVQKCFESGRDIKQQIVRNLSYQIDSLNVFDDCIDLLPSINSFQRGESLIEGRRGERKGKGSEMDSYESILLHGSYAASGYVIFFLFSLRLVDIESIPLERHSTFLLCRYIFSRHTKTTKYEIHPQQTNYVFISIRQLCPFLAFIVLPYKPWTVFCFEFCYVDQFNVIAFSRWLWRISSA